MPISSRARRRVLVGTAWCLFAAATMANPLAPVWAPRGLDAANCVTVHGDHLQPATGNTLAPLLTLQSPGGRWGAVPKMPRAVAWRVAFGQARTVGSVVVETSRPVPLKLYRLADDAKYPGDPRDLTQWTELSARRTGGYWLATLPPGTRTRALLVSQPEGPPTVLTRLAPLGERLVDLLPYAVAQGERGVRGSDPAVVQRGETWVNVGPDKDDKLERHQVVMRQYPSWFLLRWEEPRTFSALHLVCNLADLQLYALRAGVTADPAAAPRAAWELVEAEGYSQPDGRRDGGLVHRALHFPPVTTTALKLELRETAPPARLQARIKVLHVFAALGDGGLPPPREEAEASPANWTFRVPEAAEVALVVAAPDGRRVRNLFAQRPLEAGEHQAQWDLRDTHGRWVKPGTYRWSGMVAPLPRLVYRFTPYPNVKEHSPENHPWNARPQDGWLAEHGNPHSVCAVGDRVYMSSGGAEGGHAFLELGSDRTKVWGSPQPGGWLFTDGATLFSHRRGEIVRFNAKKRQFHPLLATRPTPTRQGPVRSVAAHDGKVYLSFYQALPYLQNALDARQLDRAHCLPKLPDTVARSDYYGIPMTPWRDFVSLFRLGGHIAGDQRGGYLIESTQGRESRQHVVLAFKEPLALGSLVFPRPDRDAKLRLSVLQPDAPWPPRPNQPGDWLDFTPERYELWGCVPLPPGTVTRALRLTFQKGDELDDLMAGGEEPKNPLAALDGAPPAVLPKGRQWSGSLEGMRLLRRRFETVPPAKVHHNSGTFDAGSGTWDAQRQEPLTRANPGIFALEWPQPQKLRGLAIQEIDGALTLVDVWTGPGAVDLSADGHWQQVATYRQDRRNYYQPDPTRNTMARYLDGVVDFGREVETRAVRLRVVSQFTAAARPRGVRQDRGGTAIQPARCRVYGVAALRYLGGEPQVDERVVRRLQVHDGTTGELLEERAWDFAGAIACDREGRLHALHGQGLYRVRGRRDESELLTDQLEQPRLLAFDRVGNAYVYDHGETARVVRVFSPEGKALRVIGNPRAPRAGAYDPTQLQQICALSVSDRDDLWLVYPHENPRRIIHFKTDGRFVRDYLGNTNYGGGGTLDPADPTRVYYKDMVFRLNWDDGSTRLESLLSLNYQEASPWTPGSFRGHQIPLRRDGRSYLVGSPQANHPTIPVMSVYLFDEEALTMRLAAAFGRAGSWMHLQGDEFVTALKGAPVEAFTFIWTDRNGDGQVQIREVVFTPRAQREFRGVGRMDETMGAWAGAGRYEVREFLADGTPVYAYRQMPFAADYTFPDRTHFRFGSDPELGEVNELLDAEGKRLWAYRAKHGMQGLFVPPWRPGVVDLQFGISGLGELPGGLGAFFVVHANNGQMNLWTKDGLLASHLTLHKGDPRAHYFGQHSSYGDRLDGLTLGQEHFHHYFCQTDDGRYFLIGGHNHVSVIEVQGLDRFRRLSGTIEVTPELLAATRDWDNRRARREVLAQARVLTAAPLATPPDLRAAPELEKWGTEPAHLELGGQAGAHFHLAYDRRHLYASWRVDGYGPFQNRAETFQRAFKTGAGVELKLATDPDANPKRQRPTAGDLRLLVVPDADQRGQAILYRPIAPDAPDAEAWQTTTVAGGTTHFDSVKPLPEARVIWRATDSGYVVEAAIPLRDLGLTPRPDLVLALDWGVLGTQEGFQTRSRQSWANVRATGVSDEPTEARLVPALWGSVRFLGEAPATGPEALIEGGHEAAELLDLLGE